MEYSESRPLEMFFLPFLTPSHMVPLFETARLFAARGQHVTVITTPVNASNLRPTTDLDVASGHSISLHVIPLPSKEVGLPDGLESFTSTTNNSTKDKLFRAFLLLRPKIEELILRHRPDCIVADMFYPWTAYLGIPRFHFHVSSLFSLCLEDANRSPNSPHWKVESETEPFVIPGLPDPITMTRSQLPDYIIDPAKGLALLDECKEAELKSYGLLVNSFYELESAYTEHYKKITGNKVFNVGPVALIHRSSREKSERVFKPVVDEQECLSWLNSKKPDSVLYICFGSGVRLPDVQLMEIACGLEASGHQFIWVVHGKDKDGLVEEDDNCWLPKGFYGRIKDRGLILKGWAPQVLILDHPSVGGFLTHCGWSSFTEGVCAGVPFITWPLHVDHFYIEKLATQVLGIGVEVGSEDWIPAVISNELEKKVIKREKIAKAVEMLMDGGNEAVVKMRQKVKELREMAKKAVDEGGSSHTNLTIVIEELKQLRDRSITN